MCFSLTSKSFGQRLRVATRATGPDLRLNTTDLGEAPGSQPVELTLRLGPTPAQAADLQQLLAAQTSTGSVEYHHWLTPEEVQQRFGWSAEDRQNLVDWLARNGLALRTDRSTTSRLVLQTTISQASEVFQVSVRRISTRDSKIFFANNTSATLPAAFANHIVSIAGLDNLPETPAGRLITSSVSPQARSITSAAALFPSTSPTETPRTAETPTTATLLESLEDSVAANNAAVLSLDSTMCAGQISAAERDAFHLALQQAQAQGITVLVTGACGSAADPADRVFPSALAEVSAVVSPSGNSAPTLAVGSEPRPAWQVATGLPTDSLRQAPDFAVSSLSDLQTTVLTLTQQTGSRIGNLSPTLYALHHEPELFDHPQATDASSSSSVPADWTEQSGLGTLNLQALLRLYPRAVTSTTTSLISSAYSVGYGSGFTLTATVTPSAYGATSPSGTVTFTSSTQGILGSAPVGSNGIATLTPGVLPVGQYTVVASYAGDSNYANSSSTSTVLITVSMVTATMQASIAPQTNVPYGATATVTATVSLPGPNATPTGTVTARILDVTGAIYTATLSPNPGLNTATANIVISVPPAGTHPIQVTCQGTSNFQCQTPVNLTLTTIKGYSTTSVAVTPVAPQAGDPITLTATVADGGNGTGTYAFGGSVSFFDSGKLIGTAPVATNQATTTVALSGNRTHNITAVYSGDSNWGSSTSTAVAVSPTILTDALSLSSNAPNGVSLSGVNLIFTATDTATTTSGTTPTGTVTFYDTFNGSIVTLGSPSVLVPNGPTAGIALFNTTGLQPGSHAVYAVYSGDANYAPATSPVVTLSLSSFALTMTPSTLTVDQGKSQGISVLITGSGGYTGSVSLGCVPPPSTETICSFSPAAVTGNGTSTLTIVTTAPSVAQLHRPPSGSGIWSAAGGVSLAALAAWFLPRRSRRLPVLLAAALVASFSLSSLGCGLGILNSNVNGSTSSTSSSSSSSTSGADAGTPLGTQNFTLTAAGSDGTNTVRHTYQYQVTVQ